MECCRASSNSVDECTAGSSAPMQFALIENDEELRRVIEGGDFGAWRVFATKAYNNAFCLSGGAGTGKTVVLIHRAHALASEKPTPRIVLTTFTTALSAALERDLERLDPSTPRASGLGDARIPSSLVRSMPSPAGTSRPVNASTRPQGKPTALLQTRKPDSQSSGGTGKSISSSASTPKPPGSTGFPDWPSLQR